jgi:hypothetical protein
MALLSGAIIASRTVLLGAVDAVRASRAFLAVALSSGVLIVARVALECDVRAKRTVLAVDGAAHSLSCTVICSHACDRRAIRFRQTSGLAKETRRAHHAIITVDSSLLH